MAGDRLRGHVRAQARASQYCQGDSYRGRKNPLPNVGRLARDERLCAGPRAQSLSRSPCAPSVGRIDRQIRAPLHPRLRRTRNRRDGYTIVAFVEVKKEVPGEEGYHASGTERGVVGSSSFSFFDWIETSVCPGRPAKSQPHHHRHARKPLVRQLLWGSGLRSRQPLSQREWRLPTKRSQVRRRFVMRRGCERQPDLLELKLEDDGSTVVAFHDPSRNASSRISTTPGLALINR